jgi:FkbM family methyltransferase
MNLFSRFLRKSFGFVGTELIAHEELNSYRRELNYYRNIDSSLLFYNELPPTARELIASYLPHSKSQISQDLFALAYAGADSSKFFVEFGATDGISLSNTWLLEKLLGWEGILAEPATVWHDSLNVNRSCNISTKCVARETGHKVKFLEVVNRGGGHAELSGIKEFANNGDSASDIRINNSLEYDVETISLNDLLDTYNAPAEIQFMSLDTEGSELDILQSYDFRNRKIKSMCIEHNFVSSTRQLINSLLLDNGYRQVHERVSKHDDWYVLYDS